MTEILLCSLIVSLFCLGLKISTGEGMLLEFIKVYLDRVFIKLPFKLNDTGALSVTQEYDFNDAVVSKLYYPILYCIKCMPSIYGTSIALLFFPFTAELLFQIPLVIFCSVTLNCVIYQMYE